MTRKDGTLSLRGRRTFATLANDLRSWSFSPKRLRRTGNEARDVQDWQTASKAYGAYLKLRKNDAAIWVQYGHALKEQGLVLESEGAYRQAMALMPNDPDVQLHLAHVLKRLDRPDDAKKMFSELLEISPSLEILQELRSIGGSGPGSVMPGQRPVAAVRGGIYIELKDLFVYLSLHSTVTGITRVTLGLMNHILEEMDPRKAERYNFVHQFRDAEGLLLISKDNARRMIRAAMSGTPDIVKMQELIQLVERTSVLFRLEKGDTYFIPGAFWEFVVNPSWISGMRSRGVRVGAYIYDLIPITHHQYCMRELTEAFTIAFAETARLMDFALTISAFVAQDVTNYLERHEIAPLRTVPVPLAHELRFAVTPPAQSVPPAKSSPPRRAYLAGIPFVLCVCTIEARKNHAYVFGIWRQMIEAGLEVPDLVFVGRPGWRVDELMEEIRESRHLEGRLHILNGLSDEELSDIYDRCLFTVFPSFVEGWGLPVGESLAHGKVCVASSTSSIPEVGGEHVIYVDPENPASGYEAIHRLVTEPGALAEAEARLRGSFAPRTWKMVGQDFFERMDAILADLDAGISQRAVFAPLLRAGEFFDVSSLGRVGKQGAAYVRNPVRLIFVSGWRGIEGTGTWMLENEAVLRVRTPLPPGAEVSVLLHLSASPWVGPQHTLTVTAGSDAVYRRPLSREGTLRLTIGGLVSSDGSLTIRIQIAGAVVPDNSAAIPVAIRFHGLGYVPLDDLPARLDFLRKVLLSPGSR